MLRHATVGLFCLVSFIAAARPAAAEVWNKAWNVSGTAQILVSAMTGTSRGRRRLQGSSGTGRDCRMAYQRR